MKALPILCLLRLNISPVLANDTYDETIAGKSCQEDTRQQINCTYKIGEDLEIWMSGIGLPDTGVTFAKSNFEGDYYASFGMLHLCVIIKSGRDPVEGAVAFISPQNGKAYEDWEKCRKAY